MVTLSFSRNLPIRYETDVFIAGGGPAGTAAAWGARQLGARVLLIEGHSCLGGMGTAARVPVFMPTGDGVHFLAGGFGHQVITSLGKERHLRGPANDMEALKRIYDDLLTQSGAEFRFHTNLVAVEAEGPRVSHVICASPSGLFAVRAKVFIDATGNGDLAAWAGAAFEKGDEEGKLMPGTLCSLWDGIDWETWKAKRPKNEIQPDGHRLEEAFASGVFSVKDEHLTGMYQLDDHLGCGNIGHTFNVDATDESSLTQALVWGRKSLMEFERYYREYLAGFENARVIVSGSLLGVRETRRITGEYTLDLKDYLARASFDDEIGRYAYSIDIHPLKPGKDTYEQHRKEFDRDYRYAKGENYGVPYRILTPKGFDNLLTAGRCVSTDVRVHGSLRVMPGCFITGQAAGAAAALAVDGQISTRQIDVPSLQKKLKGLGGFLPNCP